MSCLFSCCLSKEATTEYHCQMSDAACSADTNIFSAKFALNNGIRLPAIGLGTYRIRQADTIMTTVDWALDAGYRMFDTAAVYGNERFLGEAFKTLLPKYDLQREDIFIISKLSPSDYGDQAAIEHAYMQSLDNLAVDFLDIFLIHFPGSAKIQAEDMANARIRNNTWRALAEIYDDGRVNAIGVSNFTLRHMQELMASNHGVVPVVNQVEWHPYYYQPDLLNYCKQNDIVLQAYCSLGGTSASNPSLLNDPVVKRIAEKLNVTCGQVLLAWALQQDVAVIPKSTQRHRIKENICLNFTIPEDDMRALNALGHHNIKYAWDPSSVA